MQFTKNLKILIHSRMGTAKVSTMAAARLTSPSSAPLCKTRISPRIIASFLPSSLRFPYPKHYCLFASSSLCISHVHEVFVSPILGSSDSRILAVTEKPAVVLPTQEVEENTDNGAPSELKAPSRPCKLYVCNLPRSCDIPELLEMFKPYGTVQSVEVSRNAETGVSRGCGYVTMSALSEAKAVMFALDGSDVGGREMRIIFSADMSYRKKNLEPLNSASRIIFESPHKIYVGNLAWSVRSEDLKEHFSQSGTVVSARVIYDRKGGKNRVYGFISFSSEAEIGAAISLNGTEFRGRRLVVEVIKRSEP